MIPDGTISVVSVMLFPSFRKKERGGFVPFDDRAKSQIYGPTFCLFDVEDEEEEEEE